MDSGNLAGALLTLTVALRSCVSTSWPLARPRFDDMNFAFVYDPRRQLFTIGYRLADQEGACPFSHYDLLAPNRVSASFLAIAGDVAESHWFHLGRAVTSVRGALVLLSWSATMFGALMPLLRHAQLPGHAAR